jgi:pyruvate carboxylase subunit B
MPEPLRVTLGDSAHDLTRDGDTLTLDGAEYAPSLAATGPSHYVLTVGDRSHEVTVEAREGDVLTLRVDGHRFEARVQDARSLLLEELGVGGGGGSAEREVKAPMPGVVRGVLVAQGDPVEAGQGLVILEAMKMENELKAPAAGVVAAVRVAEGDAVSKGAILIELDPEASGA